MGLIYQLIVIVYVAVVIMTMVKVLLDNRQPAKTMAWMLILIFVPLAGIILYFFFGQSTRREKLISQNSMDILTKRSMLEFAEQKDLKVQDDQKALITLFASQNMALPFKDNQTEIFTSGYEFIPALLREIAKAKHHIHFESYIFSDDALGRLVSDALIIKAKQGVQVRLIYDDVGCWKVRNSFFEKMREAGIDVHAFMPVKFPAFTSKVNYRNHRKVCVIDGKVGFIGGMNIALRYVKGNENGPWRDTHMMLRGGAVYGIQRAFLVDWYFVDRTLITSREYYPDVEVPSNNCIMQIVTSGPMGPWPEIMQGYVRILLEAKHYVFMETPYFLPTDPVLFAMRTAAVAGVDVRLMVPLKADSKLVEWASRSFVKDSRDAGVKIYMYKAGFNHSKLLVSDDNLSTCGSANVDFRSFENNFEVNAFIYDEEMAQRIKRIFMRDVEDSIEYDTYMKGKHFSFLERLWESLVRLFSPLL